MTDKIDEALTHAPSFVTEAVFIKTQGVLWGAEFSA
jgi:hypothetical protein